MHTISLALILSCSAAFAAPSDPPRLERVVTAEHTIRCVAPGANEESGAGLRDIHVSMALPPELERQNVLGRIEFKPQPTSIDEIGDGERIARWVLPRMKPGESRTISWKARVRIAESHQPLNPDGDTPQNFKRWLRSDLHLDMDEAELRAVARRLRAEHESDADLVQAIVRYISSRIEYRLDGVWRSPIRVLQDGHGSCSEYAFLVVSLARLCGLPARTVGGTAMRAAEGAAYVDRVQHRWAEVWLSGKGWAAVDASGLDGEPTAVYPLGVGVISSRLLILSRDRGDRGMGRSYVANSTATAEEGARMRSYTRVYWQAADAPLQASAPLAGTLLR